MNINLIFDSNAASMPADMVAAIKYAASFYDAWFTNPITVNIEVGYGELNGMPLDTLGDANQDGRFNYVQVSYDTLKPIVAAHDGGAVLPSTDPTGGTGVYVPDAEAKALGIISGTATGIDGYVGFNYWAFNNTDPYNRLQSNMEDFVGIALHELSEALGRRADLEPVSAFTVGDLFRYSAPGVIGQDDSANYFSIDGGVTDLGDYNVVEDYLDWDETASGLDVYRAGLALGTISPITPRDVIEMAALGFTEAPLPGLPVVIQTDTNSFGSTSLTEASTEYFLYNATGFGPVLQYAGAPVVTGEFGAWVPIGAVQTASGYDVAWEIPGANEYTVWSTDSNGNYITNIIGTVAGNNSTLESIETTFNQDLNGDGTIGPTPMVIPTDTNSFGSTRLTAVANEYFLYDASGSGPVLQYVGAPVVAGQFGDWVPIGSVKTASGYDVAWENPGAAEYMVWSTDSNGNYLANIIDVVPGNDPALESIETTFNQDLNGDGTIGLTKTVIQTDTSSLGSTSLTEVAHTEYMLANASGSGPVLQYCGAVVVPGQFGAWVPIGAVQTASGYDVAWEIAGALGGHEYTVWSTDSNGNYIANIIGVVPRNDYALESIETTFNQDLNGDGTIGLTKTAIRTNTNSLGSTSLTGVANQYFISTVSADPVLQYAGAPVTAGEFAGWVPIGSVQTASGYDVAWEIPGSNEYTVWSTDSNGNYVANIIGVVPGNDYALESIETTTFHQDLNGDGTIGLTKTLIQTDTNSFGSTRLTAVANEYFLYDASGSGPVLQYGGAPVVAGEFGNWVPIGAVQTDSGYDVAWEIPGANEYTVWSTDSNGNYVANIIGVVPGNDYALESIETTTFHQDLNGDGTIGLTKTLIQTDTNSFGSTRLTAVANEYFLYDASGSGPVLQYGGAPVVAGEFGNWVPIGAVQTDSGYDVAWEIPGANEYTVWSTDSNGNYLANIIGVVPGNDYALESIETTFNQDLNGDGTIGLTKTVIQTDTNSFGSTRLTAVANEYFLYDASGSGPVLQYGGAPVVAGEFGNWVPIGAVQTDSGYDVAWEIPGANEYTVWSTDSNGNYLANIIGVVPGNDYALESIETTFNQDLNGDGTIGLTKTVIQTDTNSFGSTRLTAVANEYFLYTVSGSGPALQYAGAPVTAGEFDTWVPIGAVQTASGYDVAWEIPGANEYTVWSTDSNGNYLANFIGVVPGNDYALESIETTFNQDLNGDGTIGLTKTVIQTDTNSFGSTSLMAVANEYFLYNASGSGPALQYAGAPVTAGEFDTWVPIGAVQTASGYDVAWEIPGANEYTVWSTDSNGNYLANIIGVVPGNDYALESIETTFNQDLNGDRVVGLYALSGTTLQVGQSLAGPSGSTTIGAGATLELEAANSSSVTFQGSTGTLQLDDATTFSGQILGFRGNGSLSGSDQIDLRNINYNSVQDSYANGILTVTDGSNTAKLSFSGTYTLANFDFATDGSGGTIVYDPPSDQNTSVPDATWTSQSGSATIGTGFGGTLPLTDGTPGSTIALLGDHMASNFVMDSDHCGDTMVLADATQPANHALLATHQHV